MGSAEISRKSSLSVLKRQDRELLAEKSFTALKMRANVTGDKVALARAKIKDEINLDIVMHRRKH